MATTYLKKFRARPPSDLTTTLSHISPEGHHLLTQMLQFNPYLRPTVEQCLSSPYFNKVRSFAEVKTAKRQVQLPIEDRNLTIAEMRSEFQIIVNDYRISSNKSSSTGSGRFRDQY